VEIYCGSLKFLDGILVPLVDEKLSLPLSELSPRHGVTNTAWGLGACLTKMTKSRAFIQQGSKQPDGLTREYSGTIYRPGQVRCLVTMSLCFLEAFQEKQKGNITEQE
jgi:hypothetical protein